MGILPFYKYHGLGNDFVLIDEMTELRERSGGSLSPELVRALCDRHFGVGADQVLVLRPAPPASPALNDAQMLIFNADGTQAEMCGNGIRAAALHLYQYHDKKVAYTIETLAGPKKVEVLPKGQEEGKVVRVDMGVPVLGGGFIEAGEVLEGKLLPPALGAAAPGAPGAKGLPILFFEVSMGNPHAVVFVNSLKKFPVEEIGRFMEVAPRFPKRTNVEFVEVESFDKVLVKVWERGAGVTLACGTGACAVAVAAIATGRAASPVEVVLPGGSLKLEWRGAGHSVTMEGPAQEVFQGMWRCKS